MATDPNTVWVDSSPVAKSSVRALIAELQAAAAAAFSARWAVARPNAGYPDGTSDLSVEISGTSMTVSWTDLRLIDGNATTIREIADLSETTLTAGQALYIAEDATYDGGSGGWPVSTGTVTSLGVDAVTGGDVLLLGNWYGYPLGLLADIAAERAMNAVVQSMARTQVTKGRSVTPVTGEAIPDRTYVFGGAAAVDSYVRRVRCYASDADVLRIAAYSRSGDDFTRERFVEVDVSAGANEIEMGQLLKVLAGEFVGVHAKAQEAFVYTAELADGTGHYTNSTGFAESFTDATLSTASRLQLGLDLEEMWTTEKITDTRIDSGRREITRGRAADPVTGSAVASPRTFVFADPANVTGLLYRMRVYGVSEGSIYIRTYDRSGSTLTMAAQVEAFFDAGLSEFLLPEPLEVLEGQYIGCHSPGADFVFISASGDSGGYYSFTSDMTSGTLPSINTVSQLQIGFDIVQADAFERLLAAGDIAGPGPSRAPDGVVLVWVLGQSNMSGRGPGYGAIQLDAGESWMWDRSGAALVTLADPTGNDASAAGSAWPAMGRAVLDQTDGAVGVVVVNSAEGGTNVGSDWGAAGSAWTTAQSDLSDALAAVAAAGLNVMGCCVVWGQGESDAVLGTSGATYKTSFADLGARIDAETGMTGTPILMVQTGVDIDGDTAAWQAIRTAQAEIARDTANVWMVHAGAKRFAASGQMIDDYHYAQSAYDQIGRAVAAAALSRGLGVRWDGLD